MDQSGRKPKLLADYAPPDYLVDAVELDVAPHPSAARVTSKLHVRLNPERQTGGRALKLDGEGLKLESPTLDGTRLPPERFELTDTSLTIADLPAPSLIL